MKLSFQTVKKYLDAMEKSYLIVRVPQFFTKRTKEIIKQSKIYFIDTGLRNTVANEFDAELKDLDSDTITNTTNAHSGQ